MSDSLSYADRARKAISPSNLAVKALSIVAHHSNPQTVDDWPQVGSQRKVDPSKNPIPDQHIIKSNSLAFVVSKSISSPARLQPSHPQNKSSSAPAHDLPTTNQKVIFGSIGLETPPPLSPTPALVPPELPTKTPTSFSVGLDDSTEPVPARLKSRTRHSGRLDAEEPESSRIDDAATPTSATTQPPNKWKFGTTTSTPVVSGNGKKPLPLDESAAAKPSSSLLLQHSDTDSNHSKRRDRAISFGYIDSLLPLDENVSAPTKTRSKSKSKTKTKVTPKTKISPQIEVANQIDDVDPNPHPNSVPESNREDRDADLDLDFKVRDFGFGFGSGGPRYTQVGLGGEGGAQADDESEDKQSIALATAGQNQPSPQLSPGPAIIDNIPPPITPPHQHGPPPHSHPHGHLPRSSRRGNTFGNVPRAGGYGAHTHSHERGGYGPGYERGGYERGGRSGMNGYPRGHPSGRGYNRGSGGGGPASSHSPPSGAGGQRVPYDTVTSPLPPLPLHFSQLPHPNQQQHGMDSLYYPPPRHIPGAGPPPGAFDPYQPYPHLQQQQSHLPPPHLQGYPHFQQVPPPLPPHLLASVSSTSVSTSISNTSTSATGSSAAGGGDGVPSTSTTSSTSSSTSASPQPRNASSSSSTSPRSSSTPPSSHTSPPVPIPLTILPFPLDSIRYYLLGQLEYYMSPQNMVQDFFLRTQMDSKGYIPISLLASFNRIKQLTLDTRLVKEVLLLSAFVEVNGGMVRMGGVGASSSSKSGENESQNRSSSWESFVLPDAVESVVEDAENVVDNGYGGYHQQQLNGYGYGGSGYGYGYGAAGYGYGYGYGYPPVGPTGLGYYEDPQSQQQQQQQASGGYEPGDGVDDGLERTSHIDHGETVVPSMLMNGHTAESTTTTRKLDDRHTHTVPPTSVLHSDEKEEEIKPNGIFKHDQQQHGDEYEGEEVEEEEEEEEDVVFVMGTDMSTSWTPDRERRA